MRVLKVRPTIILLITAVSMLASSLSYPDSSLGEAEKVAASYFDMWRSHAVSNMSTNSLPSNEIDKAVLGNGYIQYNLYFQDVVRFANSAEVDPSAFASQTWYTFPILFNDKHLGSIVICHNRDETGKKRYEEEGDLILWGFHLAGDKTDALVLKAAELYPPSEGFSQSLLVMRDGHGVIHCLVKSKNGDLYLIPRDESSAKVLGVRFQGSATEGIELNSVLSNWKSNIKTKSKRQLEHPSLD